MLSADNTASADRYRFTGREWEPELGLYYYRARYYDPKLGRFISEDPIRFEAGDLNLYRYVGNAPRGARDPWGEMAQNAKLQTISVRAVMSQVTPAPQLVVIQGGKMTAQAVTKTSLFNVSKGIITRILLVGVSLQLQGHNVEISHYIDEDGFLVVVRSAVFNSPNADANAKNECRPCKLAVPFKPVFDSTDLEHQLGKELFGSGKQKLPGGTAGALIWESCTGLPYNGKRHDMKARQRLKHITDLLSLLSSERSEKDKELLKQLRSDLECARDAWARSGFSNGSPGGVSP